MEIKKLNDAISVSPQPELAALEAIARQGYQSIICNRPDNEEPNQPTFEEMRLKAAEFGLQAHHLPVVPGNITDAQVNEFAQILDTAPGPVLAYCRTGNRSSTLFERMNESNAPG